MINSTSLCEGQAAHFAGNNAKTKVSTRPRTNKRDLDSQRPPSKQPPHPTPYWRQACVPGERGQLCPRRGGIRPEPKIIARCYYPTALGLGKARQRKLMWHKTGNDCHTRFWTHLHRYWAGKRAAIAWSTAAIRKKFQQPQARRGFPRRRIRGGAECVSELRAGG